MCRRQGTGSKLGTCLNRRKRRSGSGTTGGEHQPQHLLVPFATRQRPELSGVREAISLKSRSYSSLKMKRSKTKRQGDAPQRIFKYGIGNEVSVSDSE